MKENNASVPVTIITGFLGSGKTTLLNHLIKENPATRFAIIENEFGDVGIDQELVVNAKEGIFELSNGCICCSLNQELGALLLQLVEGPYQFDHLIIETTGIAEPDGIAEAFLGEGKGAYFRLNGTVCLADALYVEKSLQERGEAVKQITFADAIVLNKTDLVDEGQLDGIKNMLRQYNDDAKVYEAAWGRVPANDLLQLDAFDKYNVERSLFRMADISHGNDMPVAHTFQFAEPLDVVKFEHWIRMMLFMSGYQIYRIKGVLNFARADEKVIFQSVRSSFRMERGDTWPEGQTRESKIVFIGYNIKKGPIEQGLKGCHYTG